MFGAALNAFYASGNAFVAVERHLIEHSVVHFPLAFRTLEK